ncbi:hypothetical protein N7478_011685 [Penicillium angulare]|uniref:uncharacterized protein n=1 Tax=Penicillium angulare TaxID=116970 RepID=UPI00254233EE|nr:uncharacterized protein N7478_011685 [Penicillium angulare]KAJ5261090.1 hypothetical protein N7478_011685 [Penicillium angulare]
MEERSSQICSKVKARLCVSTGRTCDGYTEKADIVQQKRPYKIISPRGDKSTSYHQCATTSADDAGRWHSQRHELVWPNLGSLMVLPMTGSAHAEAMYFFECVSIKHLNEYRPCESWRRNLMLFAQTVPSVRHAAIALAMMHCKYLDRSTIHPTHQLSLSKGQSVDKAPLVHYNRAIQLLLELDNDDSAETTAVTLLVCYLFTCFDHLAGDDAQAFKHLSGGLALSQNTENATFNNHTYDYTRTSGVQGIIREATYQIRRLDMQAGMFLVDWSPAEIQNTSMTPLGLFDSIFQSLDEAADHLQILLTRVMRLRSTERQLSPTGTIPPLPSSLEGTTLNDLECWSIRFERILQQYNASRSISETYPLVSLLRLQHTVACIILSGGGTGDETSYDKFLPQFKQCIAFATEVAAAHEQYSGSTKLTFTPEIGLLPVLYIIGAKCRDPIVRRATLSILRRQFIREASWDSVSTAMVIARVIEIEEGVNEREAMIQCMEQVPAWRRIEALSFLKVMGGESAGSLDITYTFCAQDAIYTESLVIYCRNR